MVRVYIALGSNLNNPLNQLEQAVKSLQDFAKDLQVSPFYGSKPHGPQDQPDYVNAVATFTTELSAEALLDKLQSIEQQQGRVRLRLTVPHIEMKNREFVIVPLYDLAPDLLLPNGEKLADIYSLFQDHQMVCFKRK